MKDTDYLDAVSNALDDGATDPGGGVPVPEVADRLDVEPKSARIRLNRLAQEDALERCHGFKPDTLTPRYSYTHKDGV